jgi:DNA-binding MarR family transcriptional regulator
VQVRGKTTAAVAPPEGQEDELAVLVVRAAKALVDRLREEKAASGDESPPLTVVHGLAARHLIGRDDVTNVELAHYLGVTKQSTSEVVGALERAGMVRRAPHPSDGRARVLLLTDEGRRRLEAGRARWFELEEEWAELVGRDRLQTVREALEAYLAADDVRRGLR